MILERFNEIFEQRVQQSRDTLVAKSKEYATVGDRLHNFKVGAEFMGCTQEYYALSLATKHLVSIRDMVLTGNIDRGMIDEKLGDAVNYMILIEAILKEEASK
jgi:hypothetical protein